MHRIIAFVLAEGPVERGREEALPAPSASEPTYAAASIPRQLVLERTGHLTVKAYHPNILLAECVREVEDAFSPNAFTLRISMEQVCRELLEKHHARGTM